MVGIIIVNYNTYKDLKECLDSIKGQVLCEYRIYIVENGSNGEVKDKVRHIVSEYSNIVLIDNDDNLGYSGGNNIGIRQAVKDGAEYVAIVNSDIVFKNDIISVMMKDIDDVVKIVGPKVYDLDGNNGQFAFKTYSWRYSVIDRQPFAIINNKFHISGIDTQVYDTTYVYDGMVSGCCFLAEAKAFEQMGLFDENVFLYSEERILSIKLKANGYKVAYEPEAVVLHKEGQSTQKEGSPFADYHRYVSDYYAVSRYCKINRFQRDVLRFLRLLNYKGKSIKDKRYVEYYKRLKRSYRDIDKNTDYKIEK